MLGKCSKFSAYHFTAIFSLDNTLLYKSSAANSLRAFNSQDLIVNSPL